MSRSKWKLPYYSINSSKNSTISSIATPKTKIHDGINNNILIKKEKVMIGYKIGEFILSKKRVKHAKYSKNNIKNRLKKKRTMSSLLKQKIKFLK